MKYHLAQNAWQGFRRSRPMLTVGAVLLILVSITLLYLVVVGWTRKTPPAATALPTETSTTTASLIARHLDGVLVPVGKEALPAFGVIVENHVDARPLSGPALANIVFEAQVEGGITRLFLLFDATSTVEQIGPVRSARPYFVDWANGWNSAFFHVGGSSESLDLIKTLGTSFNDVNEMRFGGSFFWRNPTRSGPHNVYTKSELMQTWLTTRSELVSSVSSAWHYQDGATTTERGDVKMIRVPFGGSYSVGWEYDRDRGVYVRKQANKLQTDADGTPVETENVVVIKMSAQVIDAVGRLRIKTIGSGDATAYRDGKKFNLRWQRGIGEAMKFENIDGTEFLLTRGRTWVEITTDDRTFAGLEK